MSDGTSIVQPLDPDDLASKFHHLVINKYYVIGYTVMLLYDHVLTFATEVDLIWQRRFTLPTYIFFIFRYATPIVCILNLVAEHSPSWTGSLCSRWIWFPVAIGPIISAATGIILILRIHALYNRAYWILYITVPVYLAQLAIMAWSIPAGFPAQFPPGFIGCVASEKPGTNNRLTGSYVAGLVFDACIFVLTFSRAVQLRLMSARIPLVSLVMRDGAMYFLALFIVNLVNVMLLSIAPPDLSGMNARFSNLITATLVARLVLNLRAASARGPHVFVSGSSSSGQAVSTVADVGNWIFNSSRSGRTFSETVLGLSDFDAPLGSQGEYEYYENIGSAGTWTGSTITAAAQQVAYERGRELDIELRTFDQRRPEVHGEYG